MSNMNYCRFENTLPDLRDCAEAMDETYEGDLSDTEKRARRSIIKVCIDIADNYRHEVDALGLFED